MIPESLKNILKPNKLTCIADVDKQINDLLTKKEAGKLFNLIRDNNPWEFNNLNIEFNVTSSSWDYRKKIAKTVYGFYEKANIAPDIAQFHWKGYRKIQRELGSNYTNSNTKLPRQDNKTYKNIGNGGNDTNKIRYPKKNRKTAWKRFYRLFPHLDPSKAEERKIELEKKLGKLK